MERLTHEADFGLEDWEQILYRVPADPEGAYNIFDIAERWVHYDDADCGCILQDITRKLRDYENIAPKVDELYLKKCQEVSELTKRMRWIPVKERLPEKSGVYWITMIWTNGAWRENLRGQVIGSYDGIVGVLLDSGEYMDVPEDRLRIVS